MDPTQDVDAESAIRRARMLVSAMATPAVRDALTDRLRVEGDAGTGDAGSAPGPRYDWLSDEGTVDVPLLRATADALKALLAEDALLSFGPIRKLPGDPDARKALSSRILTAGFARLGRAQPVTEAELSAAIRMFTPDSAGVRRDGVDAGVLRRSADGSRYELA